MKVRKSVFTMECDDSFHGLKFMEWFFFGQRDKRRLSVLAYVSVFLYFIILCMFMCLRPKLQTIINLFMLGGFLFDDEDPPPKLMD